MNATLRLLAARQSCALGVVAAINRMQEVEHDLLLALEAEPAERRAAVLNTIAEDDNLILAKLEGVGAGASVKGEPW